ncbi:MAG: hypothetical protein IIX05_07925, partial [Selenomonadaceae bacterium]|nr:hypothetical protein [Selenomonadaceae bacterium]
MGLLLMPRRTAREFRKIWAMDCPLVVDGDGLWHLKNAQSASRPGVT